MKSKEIYGKRILLIPYQLAHSEMLCALTQINHTHLSKNFPRLLKATQTVAGTKEFIQNQRHFWEERSKFTFGIFTQPTRQLIGHIFVKTIDWNTPKCEAGYFIAKAHQGNGYATEALNLLTTFCADDLGMAKVFLRIMPENMGSIRVAEKSGYEFEATMKKDFRDHNDQLVDVHYFSKFFL